MSQLKPMSIPPPAAAETLRKERRLYWVFTSVIVEDLAVKEAQKLNIPIVAIIDTNSDPTGIDFPIPGNDDARRAINLYCELIKLTILDAQNHISTKHSEEIESKEKTEKPEQKIKVEALQPKIKSDAAEKKSTSIFSKIKTLASKK